MSILLDISDFTEFCKVSSRLPISQTQKQAHAFLAPRVILTVRKYLIEAMSWVNYMLHSYNTYMHVVHIHVLMYTYM